MFGRKKDANAELSAGEKVKKWFRMVLVLTFKKYGGRILSHLFFGYLFGESIQSMRKIWKEFGTFMDCQDEYIEGITVNISREYAEAAEALVKSFLDRAKCIMGTLDISLPPPFGDISFGKFPKFIFSKIFGWFTPGSIDLPHVDMHIKSNTQRVLRAIVKDLDFIKIFRYISTILGILLAFFSLIMIFVTATYYTVTNKVWKPSAKSHLFRFIQFLQVIGGYGIGVLVVFLNAYATGKFCDISFDEAYLKAPRCSVDDYDCSFSCEMHRKDYISPCIKCEIKLQWWWVEPFSMPNIFGISYVAFMLLVLIVECCEYAVQHRKNKTAKFTEREERLKKEIDEEREERREKHRLLKEERERRKKKERKGTERSRDLGEQLISDSVASYERTVSMNGEIQPGSGSDHGPAKARRKKKKPRPKSGSFKGSTNDGGDGNNGDSLV